MHASEVTVERLMVDGRVEITRGGRRQGHQPMGHGPRAPLVCKFKRGWTLGLSWLGAWSQAPGKKRRLGLGVLGSIRGENRNGVDTLLDVP